MKLDMPIIVEGKYDKIRLANIVEGVVIETDGFAIFNNQEKQALIARYAAATGIIVLTDSDGAGFLIRNFIKSICKGGTLYNAYVPDVYGKEKRKSQSSAEGKLGVEGIPDTVLLEVLNLALPDRGYLPPLNNITMSDLFEWNITGGTCSSARRKRLAGLLGLPEHISPKALIDVLNTIVEPTVLIDALKLL